MTQPFEDFSSDGFSDSDWQDIASNRDSDYDSDNHIEHGSMPLSRRSSISSIDGDIDAWEGFTSDASDVEDHSHSLANPNLAEEQLINEGLEQSMISTLSSSRSSSHPPTVQNSVGDLRLSFPDPLTSSRDELSRSYEAVLPAEATNVVEEEPATVAEDDIAIHTPLPPQVDFHIVLYGAASPGKWPFVHELLGKASTAGTSVISQAADNYTRWLTVPKELRTFAIHDRTDGATVLSEHNISDKPSLAIIFLPSDAVPSVTHTSYLPVLLNEASVGQALTNWHSLNIPRRQIFTLDEDATDLISINSLPRVDDATVRQAFNLIFNPAPEHPPAVKAQPKRKLIKAPSLEINSVQAATLFALTLIVGFFINASFRTPAPPSPTPTLQSNAWKAPGSNINSTTAIALRTSTSLSLVASSMDMATPDRRSSFHVSEKPTKSQTWAEKMRSSTDVIIRPPSTLSDAPSHAPVQASTIGSKVSQSTVDPTSSSLSLKFVDSLSEFVDATKKALLIIVPNELKELTEALDVLMQAIRRQMETIVTETKSTVQLLRDQFVYRNDRAKGKARELKKRSERILSSAAEEFKKRTARARRRAFTIKETVLESETLRTYRHAQNQWAARFHDGKVNGQENRRRHSIKFDRRQYGHDKGEKRKRFFSVH